MILHANGIRFEALAEGPEDGPLVLLLHGFPELARSWRHQLPALAQAGYRAVAPNMRGYDGTEARGPYDLRTLGNDAAGLIEALGRERATVVGHDWGGVTAWAAAHLHPQRVERLVVMNAPHPRLLREEMLASGEQRKRSRYIFQFQIPWYPERQLSKDRAANVVRALRGGSHVRRPGPTRSSSTTGPRSTSRASSRARSPTTGRRSGTRCYAAAPDSAGRSRRRRSSSGACATASSPRSFADPERLRPHATNVEVVRIEDAGHYVQNEAPERVNAELLRWLQPTAPQHAPEEPAAEHRREDEPDH